MSHPATPTLLTPDLPMVDVYLPMMKSAALISAGELGLFEALADGPRTVSALAQALGASADGVARLTDLLVAVGYLRRDGDAVANTPHAARWFTPAGQVDYTSGLRWTANAWELMATLTDCVREGGPRRSLWDRMDDEPSWGPLFSRYMAAFARHLAPDLVRHAPVPPHARRLLDLGGSHGLHTMAFCEAYPALQGVIVDQASALTDTPAALAAAGLAARVRTVPGDLNAVDWGTGYDVVLFLSVMHNQTAEENARSIRRIADAMNPGGTLVIHEYPADAPLSAYDAAFRVTLLTETATGTHTASAITGWLDAAGFATVHRVPLTPAEKGTLFLATR